MSKVRVTDVFLQHGRALEWLTSCVLLTFALTLMMPGDTLASNSFRAFQEFGVTEIGLAVPLTFIAAMRICALLINGVWHRTPLLRMIGATFGLVSFSLLTLMIGWPTFTGTAGAPSTGIGVYALLAVADLIAAYRAGADVGNNSRTF